MERYVLRGGRWGYDRLQLLARVRRPYTLELLGLAGLRPGMRCVDLGCAWPRTPAPPTRAGR